MADDVRFVLDPAGFDALRKSAEMDAALAAVAARIAAAAGDGFEADPVTDGAHRGRTRVYTATYAARVRNARENTLLKALDAGRA